MAERKSPRLILVVEDDPGIRMLETDLIEDHGHEAVVFDNGADALQWLQNHQPTLLLMDYSLPDMTGIELLDRIEDAGIAVPPFIVATGAGDEYVAVDLMQRGAYHYLVKDQEFLKVLPRTIDRALRDIETASRLEEAETRLRLASQVMDGTTEGIFVTDVTHTIIEVNPAFERITGRSRKEVLGHTPQVLLSGHAEDVTIVANVMAILESVGQWQGEMQFRRKSGEIFTAWLNIARIETEAGVLARYVTLFSDISSVKASAERLDYLAHHDPLTGLPNRLLFNARLRHSVERALRTRQGLGLLFLDLDHFKEVNDRLGHAAGDDLLRLLASSMHAVLRDEDTLARLGGDEFVILVEDADEDADLRRVVDLLLGLFPHPVDTPEGVVNVTASIGGSLYPDDAKDADTLIACADQAMYAAKEAGRNTFVRYKG
jgi:diguanylate cyclase (GGDEF)-like protein/PAS domain S-box-containing protein